ncbi:MAG: tRNA uridine-5-carboxymethylaminomethyl(34) synthesis GTPase MnmE [Oscillospiraceae bacterium]|nr:tRNA uridine-5-carboxymethylaminomethyl(34) synthesis GTPase MnmE [Oscillospiraceae bacterium]
MSSSKNAKPDTIAAVATARGASAIGVIRISGPDAVAVADSIFRARNGRPLAEVTPGKLILGRALASDGGVIDECLAVVSRAPKSYTGENTAELQCHGSPSALAEILAAALKNGARAAQPGEFTKRAFLNGRIDLTQAEAVIDIIEAETAQAAKHAAAQLGGSIGRIADAGYGKLLDIAAHFHAAVDYPEEDIDELRTGECAAALKTLEASLRELCATYERGRLLKDGARAAIIGKPNAGKSSLLNALLGYDRAIVTASPGTTRDTVEEKAVLSGTLTRLIDTAGLRGAESEAEAEGISRSRAAAESSELVIAVFDGSSPLSDLDDETLSEAKNAARAVAAVNKSDLPRLLDVSRLGGFLSVVTVSAKTGDGISALADAIAAALPAPDHETPAGELLTNARQVEAAERAAEFVGAASLALARGVTPDAALVDIEGALSALGELVGRNVREDTAERIFARFCVGK